jgi:hypothetical protein
MGAEKYCRECRRMADAETHPAAFTPEHGEYNRRTPYSTPITVAPTTRTLSPAQQWARKEVLAAREAAAREAPRQPVRDEVLADLEAAAARQPTSVRAADTAMSAVRSPDVTRALNAAEEADMMQKLALGRPRRPDLTGLTSEECSTGLT